MNLQKILLVLALAAGLFLCCAAVAGNGQSVLLHLECVQSASNCIEIPSGLSAGGGVLIDKTPQMEVTREDIDQAKLEPGPGVDSAVLAVTLKKDSAARFASMTRQNVGKRLVVIVGGEVVTAPTINAAIEGGWIRIVIPGGPSGALKKLPWLMEMVGNR